MSKPKDWQKDFIARLTRLADQEHPDRASLAELRRCLGQNLGRALYRVGALFVGVDDGGDLEDAMLVAALFASHPMSSTGVNLGAAFGELKDRTGSDSVEKRFVALLDGEREDLPGRLRQAVSLLKSREIGLDWGQLLADLRRWNYPSRRVQRVWARAFWQERRPEEVPTAAAPAVPPTPE